MKATTTASIPRMGCFPRGESQKGVPKRSPTRRWSVDFLVGDTGIEPVTSSVSGKRATAAPIAHI